MRSLSDVVEYVRVRDSIDADRPRNYKNQPNLWFRGQSVSDWNLEPRVLREDFIEYARQCEEWIAKCSDGRFAEYALSRYLFTQVLYRGHHLLHESETLSPTEMYFCAQHHGLPSYLLDWTTNPLIAAFFSVIEEPEKDGALFVMRARHTIGSQESSDINSDSSEVREFVECLLDSSTLFEVDGGAPYRIMPNMRAGRMLLQSARFTLHYPGCKKLIEIDGLIEKCVIPCDAKAGIRNELRTLNVDWGTIYPDLPSFIRQVREETGIK